MDSKHSQTKMWTKNGHTHRAVQSHTDTHTSGAHSTRGVMKAPVGERGTEQRAERGGGGRKRERERERGREDKEKVRREETGKEKR